MTARCIFIVKHDSPAWAAVWIGLHWVSQLALAMGSPGQKIAHEVRWWGSLN